MNNSGNGPGCIEYTIIFLIAACIAILGPIAAVIVSFMDTPLYVKVSFLISIVIAFILSSCIKKFRDALVYSLIDMSIYGFIFLSWYVSEESGEDSISMFLIMFTPLIPIMFCGSKIKNKIKKQKDDKILAMIKEAEKEKSHLTQKNEHLVRKIENQKRIIGVIDLIKYCGADVSSIENNPAVNGIMELSNEIKENEISIEQLSAKINYLNITLKEEKEI